MNFRTTEDLIEYQAQSLAEMVFYDIEHMDCTPRFKIDELEYKEYYRLQYKLKSRIADILSEMEVEW